MTRPRQPLLLLRLPRLHLLPPPRPILQPQRPILELSLRNPRALNPLLGQRRQRPPPAAIPTSLSNSLRQPIQAQLGSNLPILQRISGKINPEACRLVVAKVPRPAGIFS